MNNKPIYNLVSLSGGKDSTAMLLRMREEGMQIDCILFCDTGLEYPAIYDHLSKLEQDIGMPITRVKPEYSFEYLLAEFPKNHRTEASVPDKGYGWAGPRMRWCTKWLKDIPREKFLSEIRKHYVVKEHIGIAADEQYRLKRKCNRNRNHVYPLVEWGMSEADCLKYCYAHGYDWDSLYERFKRVSCWCCPLQPLAELRQLYKCYPDLWQQLKDWDKRSWRSFRADYSIEQLEARFLFEQERLAEGKSITDRSFYTELHQRLTGERQDRQSS